MNTTKKGGVLLKSTESPEKIFFDFLNNAKRLTYISDGASGIIYKLGVGEGYTSGYSYIDPNYYGKNVKEVVLKLCVLKSSNVQFFKDEVNIQNEIFQKSTQYLQPLCPSILFSKIMRDSTEKRTFIKRLIQINAKFSKQRLLYEHSDVSLDTLLDNKNMYLGLIVMEYANGYKRLFDLIQSNKVSNETKIKYINYGLFIILKLAIDTGYSQGDFHIANIMIHPKLDFFKKDSGRPLILDFGYARKIPETSMTKIRNFVRNSDYISALKWICSIKRSDNGILVNSDWSSYYGWVCRDWDLLKNRATSKSVKKSVINVGENEQYSIPNKITYSNNTELNQLFILRKNYISELTQRFKELNKTSPINYPILPISQMIIKNRTFAILRGGKSKKNVTLKKRI